jgi:uncharacterized damage-inducible protein DinB
MSTDEIVRQQVLELLRGGHAHMPFDAAVADFPMDQINTRVPHGVYTPWHLLEHIRLTQRDILEFMTNPHYDEPKWPLEYWPARDAMATPAQWQATIDGFHADLTAIEALVRDPNTDLAARIPQGTGQTPLREFLLVADHTTYHLGEFAILRQVMGTWPANHDPSA